MFNHLEKYKENDDYKLKETILEYKNNYYDGVSTACFMLYRANIGLKQ
jgi:hypothetical protein